MSLECSQRPLRCVALGQWQRTVVRAAASTSSRLNVIDRAVVELDSSGTQALEVGSPAPSSRTQL